MDIELRNPAEDELPAFLRSVDRSFGEVPSDEMIAAFRPVAELDRCLIGLDDGAIVANSGAYSMEVTVPGGARVPMGGVTLVGVAVTHRRRGVLREMMRRLHLDAKEREEPLVGLLASEAPIYRRFGYGLATFAAQAKVDRSEAAFLAEVPLSGRCRIVEIDEARSLVPEVYERFRSLRVGAVLRTPARHALRLADLEEHRDGASELQCIVHEGESGTDGYAVFRFKPKWEGGKAVGEVAVTDMVALDDRAWVALWRAVLDHDLFATVAAFPMPVDDPIRLAMLDPRAYRVTDVDDWLWLHVLDVPAALRARTYAVRDALVVEVTGSNGGRFRLEGGPDGAEAERTSLDPDVVVPTQGLSSLYLGGTSARQLAAAGMLAVETPGALHRLDRMFRTDAAPWCNTMF